MPLSPTSQLVGWVTGSPTGSIHIQATHDQNCARVKQCPKILSPASNIVAGGTGYDPRFQASWNSDGLVISLVGLRHCNTLCRGTAVRALGTASRVSGLSVRDFGSRLFQLETVPGAFAIVTYDISRPNVSCFKFLARCTGKTLTNRGLAVGLAFDEIRKLHYILTSELTSTGYDHYIVVSKMTSACTLTCKWKIPGTCFSRLIPATGLAYDNCKSVLYATNGIRNLEIKVGDPSKCDFKAGRCCVASGRYRGLALLPGWSLKHVGRSCSLRPCPTCPDMHMTTIGGDPSLGNLSFGLRLAKAPGGGNRTAGLFLRVGGCTPGFPYLCGRFYAFPGFGPFIRPITGTGCNGSATWPLPLAPVAAYCGLRVCAQTIVICPANPLPPGIGLSDAIDFTITN